MRKSWRWVVSANFLKVVGSRFFHLKEVIRETETHREAETERQTEVIDTLLISEYLSDDYFETST